MKTEYNYVYLYNSEGIELNGMPKNEVIQAAGGLVWRYYKDEKKLAIIHRTRYGDEWTLPKGNLKKDETFEDAAKREVWEEIGCKKLRIEDIAGEINYFVKGKIKVVVFWNMIIEGDCKFRINQEVDKVEWVSIPKALERLTHPKEQDLVKKFLKNSR